MNSKGTLMINDILNFSKEIKDLKGIQCIILAFDGRERLLKGSNLNLVLLYTKKNEETLHKINSLKPSPLKITQISREELENNPQYLEVLSGGVVLYGQPLTLKAENTYLKAKMIIAYDTSPLKQGDRSRLNRALYGGISTYLQDGERVKKHYPGLVEQLDVQKVGKAVLILNRINAFGITQTLEKYGAKWHEIPIWSL